MQVALYIGHFFTSRVFLTWSTDEVSAMKIPSKQKPNGHDGSCPNTGYPRTVQLAAQRRTAAWRITTSVTPESKIEPAELLIFDESLLTNELHIDRVINMDKSTVQRCRHKGDSELLRNSIRAKNRFSEVWAGDRCQVLLHQTGRWSRYLTSSNGGGLVHPLAARRSRIRPFAPNIR